MPRPIPRATAIAVLILLPAIAAAVGLGGVEAYRLAASDAPLFGDPQPRSLADAITRGRGVEAAYPFIRDGQDPDALIAIDDEDYTGGGERSVSPLIAAIASHDSNIVQMLLNFGARLDRPQNRDAWCFARALGDETMQNVLAAAGAHTDPNDCPGREWSLGQPPLGWVR
jgi:hypothetical protein